jgi:hypothetical protein
MTTVFLSEEWFKFEAKVYLLTNSDYYQKTLGDFDQNPI